MKTGLLLLLVLIVGSGASATAQEENPVPDFICLLNGRLSGSFFPETTKSKPGIKSCFIKSVHKNTQGQGTETADTSLQYQLYYSPNGHLEAQFNPYTGYTLHNLAFDKKGNIILKEYETNQIKGCGNYHWQERNDYHIQYLYKKDNCVRINDNKNRYTEQTFNKQNQLLTQQKSYRLSDTSKWDKDPGGYVYTYDNKNRLQQEYIISNYLPNSMDSIKQLPPDMLRILLRQSNVMRDSIMLQDFGVTDDSLYYNQGEYPTSLTDRIDKTDSEDDAVLDLYKVLVDAYTGYEYNERGLPERRYSFTGDALTSIEYLRYDSKDRLVEWQVIEDYDENRYNWYRATMTIRMFQYNDKDQVAACTVTNYNGSERNNKETEENRKSPLTVESSDDYRFEYDESGKMLRMTASSKRWYNFKEDNPTVFEPSTYFMTYETF